ncbi:hypothetical protein [Campylobacter hyointestinalis]|nr:hypothetical protein [Campylobacter hyointestinalis]
MLGVSNLIVLEDEKEDIAAFMGIENQKIEMLFVASKKQNKCLRKKLVC